MIMADDHPPRLAGGAGGAEVGSRIEKEGAPRMGSRIRDRHRLLDRALAPGQEPANLPPARRLRFVTEPFQKRP